MIIQDSEKNDNVVDIVLCKSTKNMQNSVHLFLNVEWWISIIHNNYIEMLLFLMKNHDKFEFICWINQSLIKKWDAVHC